MPKYHLTPAGEPGICKAQEKCPYGDEEHHYSTKNQAREFYENNATRILTAYENDKNTYEATKKLLDDKNKDFKTFQNKVNDATPAAKKKLLEELAQKEQEIETLTDTTRQAYYQARLSRREGFKSGLIEKEPWVDPRANSTPSNRPLPANHFNEMTPAVKKLVATELANWAGVSIKEATKMIDGYKKYAKETVDPVSQDEYVVSIFQETMSKDKNYAFIDLETSGFSPASGEIIEIGIVVVDKDGNVVQEIDERYDMEDSNIRNTLGTGNVDIHKINPEDLEGKRNFRDANVQKEIGAVLNDRNTVMVAHNAGFERRFLNHYLTGFRDARDPLSSVNQSTGQVAAPVQDTQIISRFLNHNTTANTLEAFAESNGVHYIDAHSAFPDAEMTHKALANFRKSLSESIIGQRPQLIRFEK